jgi:small subunit ribosomal protein S6
MTDKIKKTYELAYFLSSSIKEDDVLDYLKKIRDELTKLDCGIVKEELPQLRKLAYEIKKEKEGYFGYMHFTGTTDTVKELNATFILSDDILRHLITEVTKSQITQIEQDLAPARKPKEASEEESILKEGAKSQVEENKTDIEHLDEKLEEILK